MNASHELAKGREAYDRHLWRAAHAHFAAADRAGALSAEDIERLATAAFLIGEDTESAELLARAHHEYLRRGEPECAARCCFRLGLRMSFGADRTLGDGWLARARRLLDEAGCGDCAVRGYLLIPIGIRAGGQGKGADALAAFTEAVAIGERFGDNDLVILARHGQGRALVGMGKLEDGLALFDEIMVAMSAGDASPIVIGDVYCSVITACSDILDFRRAQAWTEMLAAWCATQPDLVPHRGECMVRRAEIVKFHGAWSDAMDELVRATDWLTGPPNQFAASAGLYQQGELHRLRGEYAAADDMYRAAHQLGRSPQPGLALLRLAQGRLDSAITAIRAALDETRGRPQRAKILSAQIEIFLAAGDVSGARSAADELAKIAREIPVPFLRGAAAHGSGAVLLAEGDARGALTSLRGAWAEWNELEAPYEAARTRALIAQARIALGDPETAAMELEAARHAFEQLGAAGDLARLNELAPVPAREASEPIGTLTAREIEVLRLVATGQTNRAIAAALGISEKTVARHVSNIFMKLGLSSRAAATAFAYQHDLATLST